MRKRLNLLNAACRNIFRHKLRSLVVMLCLVAILFPFVTAISLSEGVRTQSLTAVEEGGDLYVHDPQRRGQVALLSERGQRHRLIF